MKRNVFFAHERRLRFSGEPLALYIGAILTPNPVEKDMML
jgi:hypothetical protein